jgi:hypothetical protein
MPSARTCLVLLVITWLALLDTHHVESYDINTCWQSCFTSAAGTETFVGVLERIYALQMKFALCVHPFCKKFLLFCIKRLGPALNLLNFLPNLVLSYFMKWAQL